ncbi:hypothetical protein FRC03_004686 [Tulasnella sp. 419]|nr:hypothetical protein FRC03_004686 [Tulasnella sp. 419]
MNHHNVLCKPLATPGRAIQQLDTKLRNLGAATVLNLPSVAVIGKRSSGKSSVIRGLTGVKVPRDFGLTTRCPLEVRMNTSEVEWNCQIYIRRRWSPGQSKSEKPFGGQLHASDDIELMLRRAQVAVLNRNLSMDMCLKLTHDQIEDKSFYGNNAFATDVICVDVKGPEIKSGSYVDLPGFADIADDYVVKRLEELVLSYISQPNVLILVVISMSDEIGNQKAHSLAKRLDPNGRRTIGILTKPDILSKSGDTETCKFWLNVIEGVGNGQELHLERGYYALRNPSTDQLKWHIKYEEAQLLERVFFSNNQPWSNRAHLTHRLRIDSLARAVNEVLTDVLLYSLPSIEKNAKTNLNLCLNELADLPPIITINPLTTIKNLVQSFSKAARNAVDDSAGGFAEETLKLYRDLRLAIKQGAPNLQPWVDRCEYKQFNTILDCIDKYKKEWNEVRDNVAEDELSWDMPSIEYNQDLAWGLPMYLDDIKQIIQTSSTHGDGIEAVRASLVRDFSGRWRQPAFDCLSAVHKVLESNLLALLPDYFERFPTFKATMIQMLQARINLAHAKALEVLEVVLEPEDDPFTQNDRYLMTLQDAWFRRYTLVRRKVDMVSSYHVSHLDWVVTPIHVNANRRNAADLVHQTESLRKEWDMSVSHEAWIDPESRTEPNLNDLEGRNHLIVPTSPRFLDREQANIQWTGLPTPDPSPVKNVQRPTRARFNTPPVVEPDLDTNIGKSLMVYEDEISLMAEVRAYFQLSSSQLIDTVPKLIERALLTKVINQLEEYLLHELEWILKKDPNNLDKLLREDQEIVGKRNSLLKKQRILDESCRAIAQFNVQAA